MIKKYILGILKFLLVDSTVNIIGDLFEQSPVIWVFIAWGWLAVLVMITSFFNQLPMVFS